MNSIKNDLGQNVVSIGAPASIERVKIEYPKLISRLNSLYEQSYGSYGRAVDLAISMIKDAGVKSELETASLLRASRYAEELKGSATSLVLSIDLG